MEQTSNSDMLDDSKIKEEKVDIVENVKIHMKGYKIQSIFLSSLLLIGPLFMGMAIASIGNDEYIKRNFVKMHFMNNDTNETSVTSEMFPPHIWSLGFLFPFGGWFGSIFGALTVDRYGRKIPSLIFCLMGIIGALLKIFSRYCHVALLFTGRFFDGLASSGLMVSVILLMFETLPHRLEKVYKALIQISVNFGILLISSLSLYDIVEEDWNYVYIVVVGLICVLSIAIQVLPESPKYIYNSTKSSLKTENVLKFLRGKFYDKEELTKIEKSVAENSNIKQMSVGQFLLNPRIRLAIITLIILHMGQQLSGINSIMAFAPKLLKSAGFTQPDISGLIVISIGLVGSIIFAPIVGNQRRKLLWITGFVFMIISFGGFLIMQYYDLHPISKLFFLGLFVFMFQIGPGPVCWFISVEMFPTNATGAAQGVAGFFNWFANTMVFWLFPILEDKLKFNVLFIFIGFQIAVVIYSYFFLVETLHKSSNEVLQEYSKKQFC